MTKDQIAETALQESYTFVDKPRFGLFSQPGSLAISETNYFKAPVAHKNADGSKPESVRPILSTVGKKGGTDSVLFSKPGYTAVGDQYVDPGKLKMREFKKDGFKDAGHDRNFVPARDLHRRVKHDFEWQAGGTNVVKQARRIAPGEIRTEHPNMKVEGPKKGQVGKGTSLGGTVPYVEDPYSRKKELERQDWEKHQKMLQEKPFSQRVKLRGTFATDKDQYGEDIEIPQRKGQAARKPLMTHDAPFRPSNPGKKGYNKTIDKFPPHQPDPMAIVQRRPHKEQDRPNFRGTTVPKTVPCPSVTSNSRNLRSEFPSLFRRGF